MPEVSAYLRAVMWFRRLPLLHGPLRWVKRRFDRLVGDRYFTVLAWFTPRRALRFAPPKARTFSALELVRAGKLEGRLVLEDQGSPQVSPESLMTLSRMGQEQAQPWPIFWSRHREARLVSESLAILSERKELACESVYRQFNHHDPARRYTMLAPPVRLSGPWTSLVSRWCPCDGVPTFTHWLLDALPRLRLLPEFPPETQILVPCRLAGYQKETLALLGLLERVRYTPERHLLIEDYYFSAPVAMIDCYDPYGIEYLREAFFPKADTSYTGPKRFLIRRSGKSRGIINEQEVNDFFTARGWGIVDTEKLTFAQEIQLFREAEAITGIFGSGFTNVLWCRPGCAVLPMVADTWLDGYVEWIAQVLDLRWAFRIFPSDHAMCAQVDLKVMQRLLEEMGLE